METRLLSGTELKNKTIEELKPRIQKLKERGITPHLCVVQVGDNHASNVYIGHKEKLSKKIGIDFTWKKFPENITYEKLKNEILKLNNDPKISSMIIQMPLPKHLANESIITLIDPKKDGDGLHPYNQGIHFTGDSTYAPFPCTPVGIMELLKTNNIELEGKNVVVIGRSLIVGKPMGLLLMNENATVTTLHSRTSAKDFKEAIASADIIISSTGQKDIFTKEQVKEGVVIVDVGMNRTEEGKLRGDILYKDFMGIASAITPVPGGVGPMTVTSLIKTTIELTEKNAI